MEGDFIMEKATIFDIQRNSFVDGPGIRTTVFFKGCNLKCRWCHNPESQSPNPQIMFYKDKCTGCGRCVGITEKDTDFVCFNDAKQICGKEYTVDEVFDIIEKDKLFYETSNGGVTFSGGECMLQIDFLVSLLKACKERGLHTCVDTAGNVSFESFERVLPYTDLFLYDIKVISPEKHSAWTEADNVRILSNFKQLYKVGAKIAVRVPVIPERNGDIEEMRKIAEFLADYPEIPVELLAYHRLGESKYAGLGLSADGHNFTVPDKKYMDKRKRLFKNPLL